MLQSKKERIQEEQANIFAVSLLLPTSMFVPAWTKLRRGLDTQITEEDAIRLIAKRFEVPEFAVVLKLQYLATYEL